MEYGERDCSNCGAIFKPTGPRGRRCAKCSSKKCSVCGSRVPASRSGVTCSSVCATKARSEKLVSRTCRFPDCEEAFKPPTASSLFCASTHAVLCVTCGSTFSTKSGLSPRDQCSDCVKTAGNAARKESQRLTFQAKYGVDSAFAIPGIQEKVKRTNRERFGVENQFQREEVKEAIRATNLDRYGVEHAGQSPEVRAKIDATNLKRFGGRAPAASPEVVEKTKSTNLERYGVPNVLMDNEILGKAEATMMARYGVTHVSQSEAVRIKAQATVRERHGVNSPLAIPEVRVRIVEGWMERYGVDNPFKDAEVRTRMQATMTDLYGAPFPSQVPKIREKMSATLREKLNNGDLGFRRISKVNRDWAERIESQFNVKVYFEASMGGGACADLGIGDLLIEINPTVTHNGHYAFACLLTSCALPCPDHAPVSPAYHFDRARIAQSQGLRLIQIYDWDVEERVMNLLAGKLQGGFIRHSSRKLALRRLPQAEANRFLSLYHFQGKSRNQKRCYGLYEGEILLAVATFSPSRFNSSAGWEFNRYAVKQGHLIHGGPNRLFRAFLADEDPESVISYIDFNHTTGPVFLTGLGFEELRPTGPAVVWHSLSTDQRVPQTSLLRLGADRLLKTAYGRPDVCGLNNEDIMLLEGFLPVYTAGNRVFLWAPGEAR